MNYSRAHYVVPVMNKWLCLTLLVPGTIFGQSGNCSEPFEAALAAGQNLEMDLRAGEIRIEGTDRPFLRVTCEVGPQAGSVRIVLAGAKLRVERGPSHDVHYRIEIPKQTNLTVRVTAGDVSITGITGDKDIGLRAGTLMIEAGRPELYRRVRASVTTGDLNASAFGAQKGGLFRSFKKDDGPGKYDFRASVTAGELVIR